MVSVVINVVIFVFGLNAPEAALLFDSRLLTHTVNNLSNSLLPPVAKVSCTRDQSQKIWELGNSEQVLLKQNVYTDFIYFSHRARTLSLKLMQGRQWREIHTCVIYQRLSQRTIKTQQWKISVSLFCILHVTKSSSFRLLTSIFVSSHSSYQGISEGGVEILVILPCPTWPNPSSWLIGI